MEKKRIDWIDITRGIAMLWVVLGHMPQSKNFIIYAYSFHLPLFFIISGMTWALRREKTFTSTIKEKTIQLLFPYFLWQIILIPLWLINWKFLAHSKSTIFTLLKGIMYSNEKAFTAPSNALWFLPTLFLVILLFWICENWAQKNSQHFTLLILVFSSIGYSISLINNDYKPAIWHIFTVPTAIVFFYIGYFIMKEKQSLLRKIQMQAFPFKVFLITILLVCGYTLSKFNGKISMANVDYGIYPYFYLSSLLTCAAILIIAMNLSADKIFGRCLAFIGKHTIVILALHCPILRFIQNFSPYTRGLVDNHPILCGILIICLIVPFCLFTNRYCRWLNGKGDSSCFAFNEYTKRENFFNRLKLLIPVETFFIFSLFIFGPLELYSSNAEELWFGKFDIILIVLCVSLVLFLVLSFIGLIFNYKFFEIFIKCILGVTIGLYVQGNFLNIKYGTGVLDGGYINWSQYTSYAIINSIIWLVCFSIPFIIHKIQKKNFNKIAIGISLVITFMQIPALFVTMLQSSNISNGAYTLSTDGMYTLSENENIVVFVLDTLDETYFNEFINENPEYKEKLNGFIHFDNTLASGARTTIAIPSMLTGIPYKKETTYTEYIDSIWDGDTPIDILNENGYDNRLYAEPIYFGSGAADSIKNFSNAHQKVGSYKILTKKIYKLTLYKYSPHVLKRFLWFNTAEFDQAKSKNEYSVGDAKFYKNYSANGFSYTDEYTKAFRFYLLEGAHSPYTLTASCTRDKKGTSRKEQIKGCFNIVIDMIEDMKRNHVFQSSTIIITADHGDIAKAQHPIFLYKAPNADTPYKTSHSPISLFDLQNLFVELATNTGDGLNVLEQHKDGRVRNFYLYTGNNNSSRIQEYQTSGTADDLEKLQLINEFYSNGGIIEPYHLGEKLTFTMDSTANQYCTKGFRHTTGWRTPITGHYAQMVIPINDLPQNGNLIAHFDINSVKKKTNAVISSGDTVVFEGILDDKVMNNGLNLTIPVESLNNSILTLDFEFLDIDMNEEALDTAKRTTVMMVTSFQMDVQ